MNLSGVRDYDVQYRHELSGTWASLIDDLPAGNTVFTGGVIGESYYFRVRATDNVDNEGDWSNEVGPVEVTSGAVKKYYTFNGQRVAMREGDEVYYLSGDHLGSVSLTTDSAGGVVAESRYLPFGGPRWEDGISVTDFGFTSQREESGFGLIDYNARYYSPYLNRWASPDTIIPDPTNPQSFNRYSYVRNNPVRYNDPSGHCGPLTPVCIAAALIGVALLVSTDMPINDDIVEAEAAVGKTDYRDTYPSDTQGAIGLGLLAVPVAVEGAGLLASACVASKCAEKGPAIVDKAVKWLAGDGAAQADKITVYHGTSSIYVESIKQGINPPTGQNFGGQSQLGEGFYTSTDPETAMHFARIAARNSGGTPTVMPIEVDAQVFGQMTSTEVPSDFWWSTPQEFIDNYDYLTAPVSGLEQWPQIKFNPSAYQFLEAAK